MRSESEKIRTLILDTVTLLCKSGLTYTRQLKLQGLIGITLDNTDVVLVHFNEEHCGSEVGQASTTTDPPSPEVEITSCVEHSTPQTHRRKRHRKSMHTVSAAPHSTVADSEPQMTPKEPQHSEVSVSDFEFDFRTSVTNDQTESQSHQEECLVKVKQEPGHVSANQDATLFHDTRLVTGVDEDTKFRQHNTDNQHFPGTSPMSSLLVGMKIKSLVCSNCMSKCTGSIELHLKEEIS